ncbi:MAG: hypothetical protein K6B68_06890 [Eubacterium sp.]|nr:hypothetical protein [Eubacterium sp.]
MMNRSKTAYKVNNSRAAFEQSYKFDGTDTDLAGIYSLANVRSRLERYVTKSNKTSESMSELLNNKMSYSVLKNSAWLRIKGDYVYITQGSQYQTGDYGYKEYSDSWVDGRYVNSNCVFKRGDRFSDYPHATIVLRNKSYVNITGRKVTGDLTYKYDESSGNWKSDDYTITSYSATISYLQSLKEGEELPEEFILTPAEVAKLGVDKNTNTNPEHGFIFDGTVTPGTAF